MKIKIDFILGLLITSCLCSPIGSPLLLANTLPAFTDQTKSSTHSEINTTDELSSLLISSSSNLEPTITCTTKSFNLDAFSNIILDTPGISSYQLSYSTTNKTTSINIDLTYKQAYKVCQAIKNPQAHNHLDSADLKLLSTAQSILNNIINDNMSDYEKELAIHDYIVKQTTYDYNGLKTNNVAPSSYTAAGILYNKVGVCQGYSEAIKLLLNLANIDCEIVYGSTPDGPHAWNVVSLDHNWYMLDVTWDDPVVYNDNTRIETLTYDYFNVTNSTLGKDHSWNTSLYPSAVSSTYNYFVHSNLVITNYTDFKSFIISEIQKGNKEILCYVKNFSSEEYDLDFIFKYHPSPIRYSLPSSSEGSVRIILN